MTDPETVTATARAEPGARAAARYRVERAHVVTASALVLGTLAILSAFGRRWWCECGSAIPWSLEVNGPHNSQHFVDPYSVSHFEHGLFFFVFLLPLAKRLSLTSRLVCAAGIECAWEIVENSSFVIERYRAATISLDYYGDSMINSTSDVIFAALGFVVTSFLPRDRFWLFWAAIVLACELGLILTIRDSLAINVVMLLHPIDAIRAWQSGG